MTQDSGESSIAINDYIQLNDTRNKSIKKLNKSKPRQQIPHEIVFQGFDELVRGIQQQKMNNQMWDFSFQEENNEKISVEPEKKNPALDVGFYLKKMLGILKEDKKNQQKPKLTQKYNSKQQVSSKNKKQKSRKQNPKQKEPSQKKSRKKKVQLKQPEQNNKNIKQKKKIDYVNYDNVEMENSLSRSQDSKVYDNFKFFEQQQKKHSHQLKTIERLQKKLQLANKQEKRKGSKKEQKKESEKKQSSEPKSNRKKRESSKKKQSNQQNRKDVKETINKQKQVKNHPKLQKFKVDPTTIQSTNKKQKIQQVTTTKLQNRPFKGKKQRTDPRKQSLKILVQAFSNKLKLKQFSSKITPNLFSNQLQFATAYLCSQINSKFYSRCLITPFDHRAISIVLSHKFPKEYLMDQSPPYFIQSSQNSQLPVFYNKIYQITQLQYYQEYLKTILRYNRELPRSFRFNFDQVMKQRMLKYQTFQEKLLRKQIQKLLETVGKNQRQNELMFEIKRDMLEKSRFENQQQQQRQKKIKVATKNINLNKQINENQKQVKQREGLTIIKKIKEREKKKAISEVSSKKQNKKRVIVIDQRAKFLDLDGESDPNFQSSQSQDQQISDSMERSNSQSQAQGQQNSFSRESSSHSIEKNSNSSPQESSQKKSKQVSDEEQESVVQISNKQEENESASSQQSQNSNQNSSKSSKKQNSSNEQSYESFDKQMQELIVQNESSDSASGSQNSLSLGDGISQASESIGSSSKQNRKNKKKSKLKKNQEESLESVSISMEQQQSD